MQRMGHRYITTNNSNKQCHKIEAKLDSNLGPYNSRKQGLVVLLLSVKVEEIVPYHSRAVTNQTGCLSILLFADSQ